jgi:hypothetical protein
MKQKMVWWRRCIREFKVMFFGGTPKVVVGRADEVNVKPGNDVSGLFISRKR